MKLESYDVIIVGAGPAGLKCAEILAKVKKKVLVLEKNSVIGKKVCAGGLTSKAITEFNIPKNIIETEFHEIKIHSALINRVIPLENHFSFTIDRIKLAKWQLNSLKKTSAVVKTNSAVTEIKENYLIVNNRRIFFKYLVGADGSNSIVRRKLGLKNEKFCIAMQYVIPLSQFKDYEFFFNSKYFQSWYAWIFPQKNTVSIGCAADPRHLSGSKLKENFHKWLEKKRIDVSTGRFEAATINYDFKGYQFGNIFLAGDAAGLASGLTGEGIYQALISGEEIAKIIINKNYNPIKLNEIIKKMEKHNKLLKVLEKSGPLRYVEYEVLALMSSFKKVRRKLLDVLA